MIDEDPRIVELYYDILDLQNMLFSSMEKEIYLVVPSTVITTIDNIFDKAKELTDKRIIVNENNSWARLIMIIKVLLMIKEYYIYEYFKRYITLWDNPKTRALLEDIGLKNEKLDENLKNIILEKIDSILKIFSITLLGEWNLDKIKNYIAVNLNIAINKLLSKNEI